ncbi:MAG: hypothetical protein L3K13_08055 [Thermoplasmata archaeon]|nr:hypothetical protein [Thermoplasmata archaeon]
MPAAFAFGVGVSSAACSLGGELIHEAEEAVSEVGALSDGADGPPSPEEETGGGIGSEAAALTGSGAGGADLGEGADGAGAAIGAGGAARPGAGGDAAGFVRMGTNSPGFHSWGAWRILVSLRKRSA